MDSFYEEPRTAPIPSSAEKIPARPVVPEVSMIFQNDSKGNSENPDSIYLSYNAWKTRKQNENATNHNYCSNSTQHTQNTHVNQSYLTKQVRFESPVVLRRQQFSPAAFAKSKQVPCSNNPQLARSFQNNPKENVEGTSLPGKPNLLTKPFEQIYMANIPNRHLDLSIIEPSRLTVTSKHNLENISPNVNLGVKAYPAQQNSKQSLRNNRNYVNNMKDVVTPSSGFDHFSMNRKSDDYQHPEKLCNRVEVQNIQNRDSHRNTECNKSDPLEKNRVIDLYNYKRGGYEAPATNYGHRQVLNNLEFTNNYNMAVTSTDATQKREIRPNNCLYDSFDSHNCGNDKHMCSCNSVKEFPVNPKSNATVQTEIVHVPSNLYKDSDANIVSKSGDEPTVKDLLKIIHQQNDQLLVLQKQVTALLSNRDTPKQIEAPPTSDGNINVFGDKCRTSTQLETQPGLCNPLQKCLPRKGPLPQFSLDVMTSFEVSIRRQQNLNRAYKDAINHQPKICEVTETDSNDYEQSENTNANNIGIGNVLDGIYNKPKGRDNTEVSLTLHEPVHVRQTCPSPENTVRIDMEDYSSDTDDENSSNERWFYKNVQGQVNQILRKSGIWNGSPQSDVSESCEDVVSQNIRKKVKEATIKHLKSIGVHVPPLDNSDDMIQIDSPNNVGYNPKEVSFAVKQLLMKYLPNEQLAKLAYMQAQNIAPQQSEPIGLIKRRPEFSFATVQYMQKYNLLSDAPNGRKTNQQLQMPPVFQQDEHFDRILDVTAIKQQPKLL